MATCTTPCRGHNDTKLLPIQQHDPCGLPALNTVNSVSVVAESLCIWHWALKHGQAALIAPIT